MKLLLTSFAAVLATCATLANAQSYQSTSGGAFSNFIPFGPDGTPGRPVPGDHLGNQITLAGSDRLVTQVSVTFGLNTNFGTNPTPATDNYTVDLRLNDGAGGAPGTRLAASTVSGNNPGAVAITLAFPFETLAPNSFTVVTSSTHPTNTAGTLAGVAGPYNAGAAPGIGSALNTVWYNTDAAATTWVSNSTWAIADGAATNYFTMSVFTAPATLYNNGAVNNVSATAANRVRVLNNTTANFLPGANVTVSSFTQRSTALTVSDTSHATVASNFNSALFSDGRAAALAAADQSVLSVTGGTQSANITSGGFVTNSATGLSATGAAAVTVSGGTFKGFISSGGFCINTASGIEASDTSVVSILGGTFNGEISSGGAGTESADGVRASGSASVLIRGGAFSGTNFTGEALALLALDTSHITLFGTNFNRAYGPITPLTGTITGTLQSGQSVNLSFRQANAGEIVLSPVPEPTATFAIAATACAAVLRRRDRKPER